jgi:hypothetical protein
VEWNLTPEQLAADDGQWRNALLVATSVALGGDAARAVLKAARRSRSSFFFILVCRSIQKSVSNPKQFCPRNNHASSRSSRVRSSLHHFNWNNITGTEGRSKDRDARAMALSFAVRRRKPELIGPASPTP